MTGLKEYLSAHEVADLLNIHYATLCRWRRSHKFNIPYIKFSNRILYKRIDIEEFLLKHKEKLTDVD